MFGNLKRCLLLAIIFALMSTSFLVYIFSVKRIPSIAEEYKKNRQSAYFADSRRLLTGAVTISPEPKEHKILKISAKLLRAENIVSVSHKSVKEDTTPHPKKSKRLKYVELTMGFDIKLTTDSFEKCHAEQLNLEEYTRGYNELYNFFNMLGTVFGFIASDVREKIDILDKFRRDESNPKHKHYLNVEDMMLHEIEENKQTNVELLGSRTLLRLHRALEFTYRFLEELNVLPADGKVSSMALTVYGETLAKFHPFLIRNAAKLAMYALPSRTEFMKKVVSPGASEDDVKLAMDDAVVSMKKVYNDVQLLYTKHELHALP